MSLKNNFSFIVITKEINIFGYDTHLLEVLKIFEKFLKEFINLIRTSAIRILHLPRLLLLLCLLRTSAHTYILYFSS